jgi:hypothetical protein
LSISVSAPVSPGISADFFRHVIVWLMFATSFVVMIEPAPCDLLFLLAFALFLPSGLRPSVATMPLLVLLVLFMIGGLISLSLVYTDTRAVMYIIVSAYMALSSVFLAFYLAHDAEWRSGLATKGWTAGALIATVFGIVGALDIAGTGELMSLQGRAQGLFKDPNVYSTFIVLPCVLLFQKILLGNTRALFVTFLMLLFLLAGLFLAFSRGAWLNFIAASALVVLINFLLAPDIRRRARIFMIVISGLVVATVLMAGLLMIEPVRDLFFERFSAVQSYDGGETGRFGNQLLSLPVLLVSPLGIGPINFRHLFYQDPHNVYINAFASYGWLGGFSYFALVISTIAVGVKSVLRTSSLQPLAIASLCVFFSTALQGVQIDTDHWRHFYWLLGLVWGLYAAQDGGFRVATDAPAGRP